MPRGVYKRTKEHKIHMKEAHLGVKLSKKHRVNIGLGGIGKEHGFKKGQISWNKGRKLSTEHRKRLKENHVGNTGKKMSKETRNKISIKNSGENNGCWQGGKSFEKYTIDWTNTLRISIRERDHYQCQLCGEKQGDRAHAVHHIDYNKKNCDTNNLVTLCIKCHAKTNSNRDYWINYFEYAQTQR